MTQKKKEKKKSWKMKTHGELNRTYHHLKEKKRK